MAIDTENKRRSVLQCVPGLNTYPVADGSITGQDKEQASWLYSGLPPIISKSVGGTLTPTGAVTRALEAYRSFGGTLTPSGALARALTAYKAMEGSLSPTGSLATILTIVMALGGELGLLGTLSGSNPAWLILDDALVWMGEWDETWSYDIDDVVLHKAGDEWHVFVSKIGHNTGNPPNSSAEAWHRLYQEQLL